MEVHKRRKNGVFSRVFREKRIFIQSGQATSYLRVTPAQQVVMAFASVGLIGWLSASTAFVVLDKVSMRAPQGGEVILRDAYQERLEELAQERDQHAAEAQSAQQRFQIATEEMSRQQSEILQAVENSRELEIALDLMTAKYREAASERDAFAQANGDPAMQTADAGEALQPKETAGSDLTQTLQTVSSALAEAAAARDTAAADREALEARLAELELRDLIKSKRQDEMVEQLEQAVAMSFGPMETMLSKSNLDVDTVLAAVRHTHSGAGGPLVPASVSTRSFDDPALSGRFDRVMLDLDRMNLLRVAVGKIPYAMPVKSSFRFTSGYGYRRDPKGRGRRMHNGIDLAGPLGTPIYATADGVVVSAKSEGGYGRTIRIQHELGFETVYAHQTKLHVRPGQRVSRGDHIGDMGSTGRSTGVHLHYEVHLNGRPVNPMIYLEAAKDVF